VLHRGSESQAVGALHEKEAGMVVVVATERC